MKEFCARHVVACNAVVDAMKLIGYPICYAYLFAVIFGVGIAQKLLHFSIETSRKIIHTIIVFTWVFLYWFFWDNWQIIIVPISFIIINALSYKFKLFRMIERADSSENHKGTIYFSIGITILMLLALIWPSTIMATGIATFALCFGDGPAALFGTMAKKKVFITKSKTIQGTMACFLGTIVGLYIFCFVMAYNMPFWSVLIIALATALLELVGKGYDNFSIVLGVYSISAIMIHFGALM